MTNTEAVQHKHTSRIGAGTPTYKFGSAAEINRRFAEWEKKRGMKPQRGFGKEAK